MSKLIDILNAVSNEYATNVNELAIGMASLSPIASAMGFSFEETAGVLTPVIEIFRSGGEASIALKTGLLKLVDDSKPVKDALASIGVQQTDLNGKMRSGKDILFDVSTAFGTLDQSQKLVVASQLVGIQQAARMVIVFDGLNKTTAVTKTALGAAGSAAEEVALRLASGEVAVKRFGTGFQNLAIAIGTSFRGAATSAIDGATEIENVLQGLVSAGVFNDLLNVIEDMAEKLGDTFKGIAEALPEALEGVDFTGLLDALGEVGESIGEMFGSLDLTDADDLEKAIQFVVDSITSLISITKGMVDSFKPFIEGILNSVDAFNKMDTADKEQ